MRIRGPDGTDSSSQMKFTDDELIEIIEDVTVTLGQILLTHRELTEGLLDQDTENSQRKIENLRKQIDHERRRIANARRIRRRKNELEKMRRNRLRKSQEKKTVGQSR
jgi:hypothetical protein